MARSQPVATGVTGLVVAAVCTVILATTGQAAAAEARILNSIDDVGTRTLVLSDPTGQAMLYADSVAQVEAVSGVTWALGLGPVVDVGNAGLGEAARPVPARRVYGGLPEEIALTGSRPGPGQALAGSVAGVSLGARHAVAGISGQEMSAAVVGGFDASEPLDFLDQFILVVPSKQADPQATLRELHVRVSRVEDVDDLARALPAVSHAASPQYLVVEAPKELVQLRAVVAGELGANARRLMLIVLSVGLVVVAVTLAGAVSQRRRDFGRRRALGASRSAIVGLVLIQTAVGALTGVLLGCLVGLIAVWRLAGSLPSAAFIAGLALLAMLAALVAGVPPAVMAALRDPVRILRVP